MVAGGSHSSAGGASISCSIGQIFTPTLQNKKVLTQGIQQPTDYQAVKPVQNPGTDTKPGQKITETLCKIFPNPTTNYLTVAHPMVDDLTQVEVFDMLGRNQKNVIDFESQTGQVRIHVEQLQEGSFIVRLSGADKTQAFVCVKFVKN
jgi:hypothetical protein